MTDPARPPPPGPTVRTVADDTLLAFLSDTHIGGDPGRDIFESADHLAALFDELAAHPGPVELVLAGDLFDCLHVARVHHGETPVSVTLARPDYGALFAALRRLAARPACRVTYLPGNHDAEGWWNPAVRAQLVGEGLVHEVALAYAAEFAGAPGRVVYCEHGNQFDPANTFRDYADPLDTPLGDHVVTDVTRRLTAVDDGGALDLRDIERVFPLAELPRWLAGRLFYALVTQVARCVVAPLLLAYAVFEGAAYAFGWGRPLTTLFVQIGYDVALVVLVFALLVSSGPTRAIRRFAAANGPPPEPAGPASPPREDAAGEDVAVALIRRRLERGESPPMAPALPAGDVAVFVSGHTHAPSLGAFARYGGPAAGGRGVLVNSGCWLRQLRSVPTHLRAPPVFVWHFVQTHVRVTRDADGLAVALWEHPRPAPQRLRLAERVAALGRVPAERAAGAAGAAPRVAARGWA